MASGSCLICAIATAYTGEGQTYDNCGCLSSKQEAAHACYVGFLKQIIVNEAKPESSKYALKYRAVGCIVAF